MSKNKTLKSNKISNFTQGYLKAFDMFNIIDLSDNLPEEYKNIIDRYSNIDNIKNKTYEDSFRRVGETFNKYIQQEEN